MMKTVKVGGDAAIKILEGNWWKFPPPGPGVYDIRKPGEVSGSYLLYERATVDDHLHKKGSLTCLGLVCHTTMKIAGFEFRFPVGFSSSAWPVQVCFVPYQVSFREVEPGVSELHSVRLHDLPIGRSIEEARYIVSRMYELWPQYRTAHVEFREEKI